MARGKQLQELVAQLRAETGRSQKVSVGVDEVENLKEIIRRTQEILYDDYEWPFLRVQRSITLTNNQRYYDLPSDLPYDNIEAIKYKYNSVYTDLERGITFDDYSIFDSDIGETSAPAVKWDIRDTGTSEQLEIWPIPNGTSSIGLLGTKSLNPLVKDSDRADLDDRLIVLFAASELLAKQKSGDASAKLQQANNRLLVLRRKSQAQSKQIQIGLGNRLEQRNTGVKVIVS